MSRRWRILLLPVGIAVEVIALTQVAIMSQFSPRAAMEKREWWIDRLPNRDWYFGD